MIAGDDDPIIPTANARILGCGIPDARVHRHPGGHLAIITEAPELAAVTTDFLGVLSVPPAEPPPRFATA